MNNIVVDDDTSDETDAWLIDASRRLDEPGGDVHRLISTLSANLPHGRRPGRSLATDTAGVQVNDRILKQLLATRIRARIGRLVVSVAVDGNGEAVDGVHVGLIARYHDDMVAASDHVRDVVDDVLHTTLGISASDAARRAIGVRWQDVYAT
ncbi:hypothetical protein AAFP30_01870 [Gordonia sp. CPCC 205515]|uniref:hypothetical protein n=1 Tax=Gordonia sp. CPCC 205515 TaxID=3140791 RepID=UPI003AF398F3